MMFKSILKDSKVSNLAENKGPPLTIVQVPMTYKVSAVAKWGKIWSKWSKRARIKLT